MAHGDFRCLRHACISVDEAVAAADRRIVLAAARRWCDADPRLIGLAAIVRAKAKLARSAWRRSACAASGALMITVPVAVADLKQALFDRVPTPGLSP
jgi:hypothetical protein